MAAQALPLSLLSPSKPTRGGKSGRSRFLLFPVNCKPGEPVPLPSVRRGRRNRWGGGPCGRPRGGRDAAPEGEDVAMGVSKP